MNVELDIVFIDGMHAFPWPILDWYSTADHLKVGGLMIIDHTQLPSVGILSEFLRVDSPRWLFAKTVGGRKAGELDPARSAAPNGRLRSMKPYPSRMTHQKTTDLCQPVDQR
jgi:hypothetical protein